jgi:hypothetical protein
MPKITVPTYVDDHDGKPLKEDEMVAVRVGWDNKTYKLYLSEKNRDKLAAIMAEWIKPDTEEVIAPMSGLSRGGRAIAEPKERAPRTSMEDVKQHILGMEDKFRISELQISSPATVRKALDELIESGAVEDLGNDPEHSGKGRAPKLYAVSKAS